MVLVVTISAAALETSAQPNGPNKYRKYHIYGVSSEAAGDSAEPEEK